MTRLQLEYLIGSQAILGQFPDAPSELLVSREADVYPRMHPERAELIDGSIGEGSPFEPTHTVLARRRQCCRRDGRKD